MYVVVVVVFGLSMARRKGNQDGPCPEAHLCHQPAHTQSDGRKPREILLCRQLFDYACLPLFQCDTSGHLSHCLHLGMFFLNCIVKVASLCSGWIIEIKPFCRILIPTLFRKNNYSPVKLPGSCTIHIAHTYLYLWQASPPVPVEGLQHFQVLLAQLKVKHLYRKREIQWNLSIKDTLNEGHLTNEDTNCSPTS